jgi:putative DNA primase/helicase
VFSVNIFPRVDDTTTATERRICCLQFLNNWRDNPNPKLRSDVGLLAKELPGILNWMIEGAIDLANTGSFVITNEQTRMLDEYRAENSSVEGFIVSCITLSEFSSISTTDLYEEYRQWSSTDGGRKTKANITFTKEMKAYGAKKHRFKFEPRSDSKGESRFIGIMLNPLWTERSKEGSGLQNDNYKGWHK